MSLGNLVLVDYVRSMIDLLLDYMTNTTAALEKARSKSDERNLSDRED